MNNSISATIKKNISIPLVLIWLSVLVSVLVTITSISGIFFTKTYSRETEAWAVQAIGQDYVNLVAVALLLVTMYYVSKKSFRAYLVWLGTYIYLIYSFAIYAFSVHFNFLFLAYVAILGMAFYTLAGGLMAVDTAKLSTSSLSTTTSKRVSGLLMGIGILFGSLWLSEIIPNLVTDTVPVSLIENALPVNPVHVLDLAFLVPGMIITSVLLWRKHVLGFQLAVPLLVFFVTMGMVIIAIFINSAIKGMQASLPAGIIISLMMLMSAYFSYRFLKEVKEVYD